MKGKKSSHIHNQDIRYFQKILANTIFVRWDSRNVNMKELFFINCEFKPSQINSLEFMLTHFKVMAKGRGGSIVIIGFIKCIALATGLYVEVVTLYPIAGSIVLDIASY